MIERGLLGNATRIGFKVGETGILSDINARIKYLENQNKDLEQELQRKDNIINELKEWLDKEKENYNLELTKKNEKALSYSLPIKNVYRETLDKIKELEKCQE